VASLEEHLAETTEPGSTSRSANRVDRAVAVISVSDDLSIVREPHVVLALWERDRPAAFFDVLDSLDLGNVDDLDMTIHLPVAASTLAASLIASGYPEEAAVPLAADIRELGRTFAMLTDAGRVRVRLEVVETDACRKFHADYVTLRLLATYRGPATQWVRTASPETIEQAERGAAVVLKGRLMLQEPVILHRSPPITSTGKQRLLLTIDTPRESAA
jgi:hypothetical protein